MAQRKDYVLTSPRGEKTIAKSLDEVAEIIGSSHKSVGNKVNSGMKLKGFMIETLDSYLVYHKEEI